MDLGKFYIELGNFKQDNVAYRAQLGALVARNKKSPQLKAIISIVYDRRAEACDKESKAVNDYVAALRNKANMTMDDWASQNTKAMKAMATIRNIKSTILEKLAVMVDESEKLERQEVRTNTILQRVSLLIQDLVWRCLQDG